MMFSCLSTVVPFLLFFVSSNQLLIVHHVFSSYDRNDIHSLSHHICLSIRFRPCAAFRQFASRSTRAVIRPSGPALGLDQPGFGHRHLLFRYFGELSLPVDSNLNGNELFQLADCSTSETSLPALGKSRVRRIDDSPLSCANPNAAHSADSAGFEPPILSLEPVNFDQSRHSITCWEITFGRLPYAVVSSGDGNDVILDRSIMYRVREGRQYSPTTLYRATISTRSNPLNLDAYSNQIGLLTLTV